MHLLICVLFIRSCKKKSQLYKKYILNPSDNTKANFVQFRNKLKSLLRAAEKNYYAEKFIEYKQNLKYTWKLIRSVLNQPVKKKLPTVFEKNGNIIEGYDNIVEEFNDYFVNIGRSLSAKVPEPAIGFQHYLKSPTPVNSFSFKPCTSWEIFKICNELPQKYSTGHDHISSRVVKHAIEYLADILAELINCSMQNGVVPNELKIAKVVPIYKTGDTNIFSNYRPISVLPFFSKLFEKAIANRITEYMDKFNVINNCQFGFRKQRSTDMAVIEMIEKITQALDSNSYAVGIFLDLSKAFDTVNHTILLSKLEHYGIRGIALKWFKNYLSDRYQYVSIENFDSRKQKITCGVPQGSILGPILFLLYINDIINSSSILHFILFADDTNLFYCNKSMEELNRILNDELHSVVSWINANKLTLNIDKTNFIVFKSINKSNPTISVEINGNIINRVHNTKFLGVYVDENLAWNAHVSNISKKVSKNIGILYKLRYKLPTAVLLTLYNSLLLPYFSYCNIVWACCYHSRLASLIVLQKRAVRIVSNISGRAHTSPLFRNNNILKITDINNMQVALFMFKYYNSLLPPLFDSFFALNVDVHSYFTRSSQMFHIPSIRTNMRKHSIVFVGPRVWNHINPCICNSQSVNSFKFQYKKFLLSQY